MKKRQLVTAALLVSALFLPTRASAGPIWYDITFSGTDIWTYSADVAGAAPFDQSAPRRYRDFDICPTPDCIAATTYGVSGSTASTTAVGGFNPLFGALGAENDFAFDEINLWGAGGAAASATAWDETYVSVGNSDPLPGVSSWTVTQAPTGWTFGIVEGGQSYSADATHAFPVWRSGTGATLSQANMSNPDFVFGVRVLIDTINGGPADSAACAPTCELRVFFGGFNDDGQQLGPGNHEVSGIMTLQAQAVPEPATLTLLGLGLVGAGFRKLRARKP